MDYNTQRERLVLPEYGRHIQQMVNTLFDIEDKQERTNRAKSIIAVMGNMNPHLRDINDFRHKLWDHLHIMSDFQLDIDSPYPKPNASDIYEKPKGVEYPSSPIKYKHYGRSIGMLVDYALNMEEGEEKDALMGLIANHMKKLYQAWNKESVSDEDIIKDLAELSDGQLILPADSKFTELRESTPHNRPRKRYQPRKR